MKCAQVRELFGAYWDDETTQAEREALEAHFASCAPCRGEYETYAHALELVGALPRVEPAPDLVERAVARARRSETPPDRVGHLRGRLIPVTAAVAVLVLAIASVSPWLHFASGPARNAQPPATALLREPVLVQPAGGRVQLPGRSARASGASDELASVADSLFDHSEDVEFILDPVTLKRGHAHTMNPAQPGVQGEKAVITF